ncbi:hypothetical protein HY404_03290 [Candidatus Microgenomates bacterium]|nr:hypothetical protein [Candidatus Microgenomates bacterium]
MSKNNVLEKKIIENLEKVGFPVEVAISSDLENDRWIIYNGALFEDSDISKTREIDIHAVKIDTSLASKIKRKTRPGDENGLISI